MLPRWVRSSISVTVTALLALAVLCLPRASMAQYRTDNPDWNGLSDLTDLGRQMGIDIEPTRELKLDQLREVDGVLILYPLSVLEVEALFDYVADGGRIALADDFGRGEGLMRRVGVQRDTQPARSVHKTFHIGREGLPLLHVSGQHFLLTEVDTIVANHPSVLTSEHASVVSYEDESRGFVYDLNVGEGKLVIIADPSLFINLMLSLPSNRQFVANVMRYTCGKNGPCRLRLVAEDFTTTGEYLSPTVEEGSKRPFIDWSENVARINEVLRMLVGKLPHRHALYVGSLILMIGVTLFLLTLFPMVKARFLRFTFRPQVASEGVSEFEWNLSRFDRKGRGIDYALPMSILREEFEQRFIAKLQEDGHLRPDMLKDSKRLEIFTDIYIAHYVHGETQDRQAERARLLAFLRTLAHIPPRHHVYQDGIPHQGERELVKLYEFGREVLIKIGADWEHE